MSLETRFKKLASARNIDLSDTDIHCAVANFVNFARVITELNDETVRNFSPDKFAATRQRLLVAGANYTPTRICGAAWDEYLARGCHR